MNLPYQCLTILGQSSILCAAQGTSIHTFDLENNTGLLSSWSHPAAKQGNTKESQGTAQEKDLDLNEQENGQPPSKKRKLSSDENAEIEEKTSQADAKTVEAAANGNGNGNEKKKQKPAQRPELPFVILLAATEDGSHVVSVTGQDKTLWVFEHDGKGTLKELSQRVMPKRPSSIAITKDGSTILSADKFGDVYSLPLISSSVSVPAPEATPIPTPAPETPPASTSTPISSASTSTTAPKPSANRFTVHSKRNLRALEEQERQLAKGQEQARKEKETPSFQHDLVLGHVSMLTSLVLATASSSGKQYIITGDRDEHIRVSRGPPQAHIIETYCLGHEAFVNALCVPAARPELLVSGGGDDELFLWEWKTGRLLQKADLLGPVKEVAHAVTKIAVSKLASYELSGRSYVLAICEQVPAFFISQLQGDVLRHTQTVNVPGSPLDALVHSRSNQPAKLVVAIDPMQLQTFELDAEGNWEQRGCIQGVVEGSTDLTRKELDDILYPIRNLRKTEVEDEAEDDSARNSVVP
ncbi:hypothetical protein M426DRAFT_7551 [Hypoxylon sp. CI-4A]|nr:hypothetical protein M426DRAFT_7551 [Hypoxylon sp. CI-4A]